jgi:hypothetical protein
MKFAIITTQPPPAAAGHRPQPARQTDQAAACSSRQRLLHRSFGTSYPPAAGTRTRLPQQPKILKSHIQSTQRHSLLARGGLATSVPTRAALTSSAPRSPAAHCNHPSLPCAAGMSLPATTPVSFLGWKVTLPSLRHLIPPTWWVHGSSLLSPSKNHRDLACSTTTGVAVAGV